MDPASWGPHSTAKRFKSNHPSKGSSYRALLEQVNRLFFYKGEVRSYQIREALL